MWKRVGRIQADRDQQRLHLAGEIGMHPGTLRLGSVAVRHHVNALLGESGGQDVVVQRILTLNQAVRHGRHAVERCHRVLTLQVAVFEGV